MKINEPLSMSVSVQSTKMCYLMKTFTLNATLKTIIMMIMKFLCKKIIALKNGERGELRENYGYVEVWKL